MGNLIKSKIKLLPLICLIVFVLSTFMIGYSYADTDTFLLSNVEVISKSETTEVNSVTQDKNEIICDVVFHKLGDSITYRLTLKNNDNKDYTIKSLSDTNESEYIEYSYENYEETKFIAKSELTLDITVKYIKEVTNLDERIQNSDVSLKLSLIDKEQNEVVEEVNINNDSDDKTKETTKKETPKTDDRIYMYIMMAIVSYMMFFITIFQKGEYEGKRFYEGAPVEDNNIKHIKGKRFLSVLLAMVLIYPTAVRAMTDILSIEFTSTVGLMSSYRVTYDVNGEEKEIIVKYNEKIEGLEDPVLEHYSFEGWLDEYGDPFDMDTPITEDTRILADFSYIPNHYTVILNANGGEGEDIEIPFEEDVQQYLPENTYTRTYYKFTGWNTKADGTGNHYNNGAPITNLIDEGEITLYAEWEEKIAEFEQGYSVNIDMKQLAGQSNAYYLNNNNNIKAVRRSENKPDLSEITYRNVASAESDYPIYMWFDSDTGTIYFWTEVAKPKFYYSADATFYNFNALETIDIDEFDTSGTQYFGSMFSGCNKLKNIDLSNWDFSNAISMSSMFYACTSADEIILPKGSHDNLTNTYRLFYRCDGLKNIDLSDFKLTNVTNMSEMFYGCSSMQNLDLSGTDVQKVQNLKYFFYQCMALKNVDLSSFRTTDLTNMYGMFWDCIALESVNLSSFDTRNVTDMSLLFRRCQSLEEVDLSSFSSDSVTTKNQVFMGCSKLKTIYASDQFRFTGNIGTFVYDCANIVGGMGTKFNSSMNDYAHIDEGSDYPGIFTDKNVLNIDFDANGGTGDMEMQTTNRYNPEALTANTFEGKTGKVFVGWNTEADGTGVHFEDKAILSDWTGAGYIKLYAEWE